MTEDDTLDDIMKLLELIKDIQEAEEDFINRRTFSHKQVKRKMTEKWLK